MKMIVPFAKGALKALGSNEKAARLTGIQVDRVKIAIFSITGLLSGVAALLYIARFGSVDVATAGSMFKLNVILPSGTTILDGCGSIQGTFFGAVIIYAIDAILSAFRVPAFVNDLIKGPLILGAVLLQKVLDRRIGNNQPVTFTKTQKLSLFVYCPQNQIHQNCCNAKAQQQTQ